MVDIGWSLTALHYGTTRIRTDENEADLKSEVDTAEESRLVDGTS